MSTGWVWLDRCISMFDDATTAVGSVHSSKHALEAEWRLWIFQPYFSKVFDNFFVWLNLWYKDKKSPFDSHFSNNSLSFQLETNPVFKNNVGYTENLFWKIMIILCKIKPCSFVLFACYWEEKISKQILIPYLLMVLMSFPLDKLPWL